MIVMGETEHLDGDGGFEVISYFYYYYYMYEGSFLRFVNVGSFIVF